MKHQISKTQVMLRIKSKRRILLLSIVLFLISSGMHAQEQKVSINLKDTTLEYVINSISKQTNVNIIYSNEEVEKYKKVSVNVKDGTVEDALKKALSNTQLICTKENGTIVITKNNDNSSSINPKQLPTQTIRGIVIDKDAQFTIIGANVIIIGTDPQLGASTDVDGKFRIENVPIGRQSIKVSYLGYEDAYVAEFQVGSGKEIIQTIQLTEKISQLNEIVIVSKPHKDQPINTMATVSARSFTVEETSRYAGSFADPGRMASAFAGVVSNNSFTNEITVRGNSPTGLLWRLEGIEIPSPNHLAGYSRNGGVVTILSPNAMGNSDFMTGAFPAEYGNASSGVFDIRLRNGNNEKREYAFQASLLGLEASAEGPFRKGSNASYLVNYRYSTTSLFGNIGLLDKNDGLPFWQDLNLKINMPTKKAGVFTLFAVGGKSGVNETAQKDSSIWENENDNKNSSFYSNVGVVGASHIIFLNSNTYVKTVVSYSIRATGDKSDTLSYNYDSYFNTRSQTKDNTSILSSYLNHKFNSKNTIRAGVIANRKEFSLYAVDLSPTAPYVIRPLLDATGDFFSFQSYAQWKYRFTTKLELNTGVHSIYTQFNNSISLEPRAAVRWFIHDKQSLNFGFGVHSRMEPSSIYFEDINVNGSIMNPNKSLKTARSNHYVISYDRNFSDNLRLKLEVYYQDQRNVPIADDVTSTFSLVNNVSPVTGVVLVNKGSATNKGIELTLEKFFDRHYYFLLTGSLYDAKYKAGDGVERNTRYNGNYVANFLIGKEFPLTKSRLFGLDFRFVVAGGNRLTPIDLEASKLNDATVYDESKAFSEQAQIYFRPDVKFSFTKNKGKTKRIFSLDIQNLSNHQNLFNLNYDQRKNDIVKNYQFGILPNISYRIVF